MKWLRFLLLFSLLLMIPLQSFAAPSGGRDLPEVKYDPGKREANNPLNKLPEVKPGADIPGRDKFDIWAMLEVQVIDGRTKKPLKNAEVVLAETGYRTVTDGNGMTKPFPAPVIRDPRFEPPLGRLHGQLTLISYKNGYRDTVYFNVRMRQGILSRVQMWMYAITPEDRRIEPWVYFFPTHRIFVIELVNKFRSKTQPGAGQEEINR